MLRRISIVLCMAYMLFTNSAAYTQLTVTNSPPYNTAQYLVDSVLLGAGIIASGHTYNGAAQQIGYFNGVNCNVGLNDGIIMCTGGITSAPGPNNVGSATGGSYISGNDPDITQVIGFPTYDAAVLQFDFIAPADSVKFNFVFASEEYSEWVNTSYNDGFGFFLSGPGINGPYSNNAINIALIPNSSTEVMIGTCNNGQSWSGPPTGPCTNCAYWNYNGDGSSFPYNSSATYIQYDAFTDVLTAKAAVQCGQTYHIKLAIADGSDGIYDSGVFLEAGSFQPSGGIQIFSNASFSQSVNDTAVYEGCGFVCLDFVRTGNLNLADTAVLNISGSAINGTDYAQIPDTIFFGIGQDTVTICIDPPNDFMVEGIETVKIEVIDSSGCSNSSQIELTIDDPDSLVLSTIDDTISCLVDSIQISVSVLSGMSGFTYNWSSGDTVQTIWVSPSNTTQYYVTVTDTCGISQTDSLTVVVIEDPVSVTTNDVNILCPGDPVQIGISIAGGYPPYSILWSNGWTDSIQTVSVDTTTTFWWYVTDQCGLDTVWGTVTINVPIYPPILLDVHDVMIKCPGDQITIGASASGGSGSGYSITWNNWSTISDSLTVSPNNTTTYTVQATDGCNSDTATATIKVTVPDYPPMQIWTSDDQHICPGDILDLWVATVGGTGVYTYQWNPGGQGDDTLSVYPQEPTAYTITVTDECGNSISEQILVDMQSPEAEFSHEYLTTDIIQFENLSSKDAVIFDWDMGDGSEYSEENPQHSYNTEGEFIVSLVVTNEWGCQDSTQHIIRPPMKLWVPNAFTPDANGLNEFFEIKGMGVKKFNLYIFDRWGEMIFSSDNIDIMWDGKYRGEVVPEGVYIFKIIAHGYNKDKIERVGHVSVIK